MPCCGIGGGEATYAYDKASQRTKMEDLVGVTSYTYDGNGKWRQYEDSAGLRKFVWDGENILLQTEAGGWM